MAVPGTRPGRRHRRCRGGRALRGGRGGPRTLRRGTAQRTRAVRFSPMPRAAFTVVADGDGDGVNGADVAAGIDPIVRVADSARRPFSTRALRPGRVLPAIDEAGLLSSARRPDPPGKCRPAHPQSARDGDERHRLYRQPRRRRSSRCASPASPGGRACCATTRGPARGAPTDGRRAASCRALPGGALRLCHARRVAPRSAGGRVWSCRPAARWSNRRPRCGRAP